MLHKIFSKQHQLISITKTRQLATSLDQALQAAKERLVQLKLPTLKYRRLRGDMV